MTTRISTGESAPQAEIAFDPPPPGGAVDAGTLLEERLVTSALDNLRSAFELCARRDRLSVEHFGGCGTAVLDRAASPPRFTSLDLHVRLRVAAGDEERARRLLELAESKCIISNVLKVRVTREITAS